MGQVFCTLVMSVAPVSSHSLILIVGVLEIAAGIAVATRPRLFWYVLGVWALGIAANLWLLQSYQGDWPFDKFFRIGK